MKNLTPAKLSMFMFVVVGGLIAAYVAKNLLATEEKATVVQTRTVPMALAELKPGTVIGPAHIGSGRIKVTDLAPEMLLNEQGLLGRVVKAKINAANPIFSSQLYLPNEHPPLPVGKGMRAVSVSVGSSTALVDGLIRPGEYADIHLTPSNNASSDPRFRGGLTLTLFKGVKLLAINQSNSSGVQSDRLANTVTLELTPEQANIMILASNRGDVTLSYNPEGKGTGGVAVSSADRATLDEILGLKPLPKPAKPFVTEVYKGGARSSYSFRNGVRTDSNSMSAPSRNGGAAGSSNQVAPSNLVDGGPSA